MRFFRPIPLAAAGLLIVGLAAAPAQATPASGVSGTVISTRTVNGTEYVLREITIQPGGYTGWHYHDGALYGVMEKGTLTRTYAADHCAVSQTLSRGQTFVEPAGKDNVHIGRNLGGQPAVLLVLYVLPAGSPLSEDAADPGCS